MGIKDTTFDGKLQCILGRINELNYTEMSVGTYIQIGYVVIYIFLVTVMLAIGLFYTTQLCSFL